MWCRAEIFKPAETGVEEGRGVTEPRPSRMKLRRCLEGLCDSRSGASKHIERCTSLPSVPMMVGLPEGFGFRPRLMDS